jgi:NADPH:quinone reductase-like Zn-dependent oxidoreductase
VGTFAVQLAKAFGAEVTGVCSTAKTDLVRSIGADRVIDYTREDFTRMARRYDLMLDIAGNRTWSDCKRVLNDHGTLVIVGGPKTNRWIGPLGFAVGRRLASVATSRRVVAPFLATVSQADLLALAELLETGKIKPVIERRYALEEAADAVRCVGAGHARGKHVLTVSSR